MGGAIDTSHTILLLMSSGNINNSALAPGLLLAGYNALLDLLVCSSP